jgi:hypothetical protein
MAGSTAIGWHLSSKPGGPILPSVRSPLIKGTEATATVQSIADARTKCLELIDQLDRRRHALREALAELRYLDKLLSRAGRDQDDGVPLDHESTQNPA